jgi:hypothetical protein
MPPKKTQEALAGGAVDVLKDMLIVQLGIAGVPQREIRDIVGCDLNRVTRIVGLLKPKQKHSGKGA